MQPQKKGRKEVEDPQNTWNSQLMEATLRFDVAEAEALIEKGADPVNAREPTPFSRGDLLSPLGALMLQGLLSEEGLKMAQLLVDHGASLDSMMSLPGPGHFRGSHLGGDVSRPGTASQGAEGMTPPASREGRLPQSGRESQRLGGSLGVLPVEIAPEAVEKGTILHYAVALGDYAHLLQMLTVAGKRREALPQCLMQEISLGFAIPQKPSSSEIRASSRGKKSLASNSPSRRLGRSRSIAPDGRGPRSALPTLTELPEPMSQYRLKQAPAMPVVEAAESVAPVQEGERVQVAPTASESTPIISFPNEMRSRSKKPTTISIPLESAGLGTDSEEGEGLIPREELLFVFEQKGSMELDAAHYALSRGDITACRLLTYYGAQIDFQQLVNSNQTILARACCNGDLVLMERLLDAGDSLTQISACGRYTLMHYAAAHPSALEYLVRRGLSPNFENIFGESALISLIRHGFGRNSENSIRETPRMSDGPKLLALPHAAIRNYILTPMPSLGGGAGGKGAGKYGGARAGKGVGREPFPQGEEEKHKFTMGGKEAGTWWAFSALSTAEMIQHLVDAGADVHGTTPTEDEELRYHAFTNEASRAQWSMQSHSSNSSSRNMRKRNSVLGASLSAPEEPMSPGGRTQLPFSGEILLGRVPLRLTPLMWAIYGYHPELIRKLVMEYHVDLSGRDSVGASCMHYAAICPHSSVLEFFFSFPKMNTNVVDMSGRTPLHYAAAMGNMETTAMLLSQPSTLAGRPDNLGLTPLHLAVLANETKIVEMLLSHSDSLLGVSSSVSTANAKASRRQKSTKANTVSLNYRAAPSSASTEYQLVDVEAEEFTDHATALELAVKHQRDAAIVRLLLQEGHALIQRWSGLDDGGSLLHRAVVDNREDYVQLLLDYFADPNEPNNEEFTPLYLAVDQDAPNMSLIKSLINAGAYSYAQSGTNLSTPLHVAAKRGNAEVLRVLLTQRMDPYKFSTDAQRAPTHWLQTSEGAGRSDESEESAALGGEGEEPGHHADPPLIHPAFLLTTDWSFRIPLHILCAHETQQAQQSLFPLIQKILQSDLALPMCKAVNEKGRTPLHEACRANYVEAVQLLLTVDPFGVYCVDAFGNTPLHDAMYTILRSTPPPMCMSMEEEATDEKLTEAPEEKPAKEDNYSDEEYYSRVEKLVVCLTDVVQSTVPHALHGLPLINTDVKEFSPSFLVTTQLKQKELHRKRWLDAPFQANSDSFGTPSKNIMVHSLQEYLALTDRQGRTPLLLAGEQGNTIAGRAIIRIPMKNAM